MPGAGKGGCSHLETYTGGGGGLSLTPRSCKEIYGVRAPTGAESTPGKENRFLCAPLTFSKLYIAPLKKKHYKSPLNLMSLLIHRHLNEWLLYIRESLNKENTEKRFFLYLHPVPVLPQYIYIYIFKRSCHFFRSIFEKPQFSKKRLLIRFVWNMFWNQITLYFQFPKKYGVIFNEI